MNAHSVANIISQKEASIHRIFESRANFRPDTRIVGANLICCLLPVDDYGWQKCVDKEEHFVVELAELRKTRIKMMNQYCQKIRLKG